MPPDPTHMAPSVLISEVGPRDGLQSVKTTMLTADKLRWILPPPSPRRCNWLAQARRSASTRCSTPRLPFATQKRCSDSRSRW